MNSTAVWAIILGGMLVTYSTRLSFLVLVPYDRLPRLAKRGLRYVPSSILAAIILPELVAGPVGLSPANPRLLAGIVAGIIAWRFQNTWMTLLVGMLSLWMFSLFM